jgi:hypothetical protein
MPRPIRVCPLREAKLSSVGNALTENRHKLVVEAELGSATGTIEREVAVTMVVRHSKPGVARRFIENAITAASPILRLVDSLLIEWGKSSTAGSRCRASDAAGFALRSGGRSRWNRRTSLTFRSGKIRYDHFAERQVVLNYIIQRRVDKGRGFMIRTFRLY